MHTKIDLRIGDEIIFVKRTQKKRQIKLVKGTIKSIVDSNNVIVTFSYDQQPSVYYTKIISTDKIHFVFRNDGVVVRIDNFGAVRGFPYSTI